MKKTTIAFIALLVLLFAIPAAVSASEITVFINGVEVKAPEGEVAAFVSEHGQTVIGARTFLDALKELEIEGADTIEVGYDEASRSSMWGKQLTAEQLTGYKPLQSGIIRTFFDGQEGSLTDTNTAATGLLGIPIMRDNRTYFPLRALLNWVGIEDITYDGEAREVGVEIPEGTVLVTKPENVVAQDTIPQDPSTPPPSSAERASEKFFNIFKGEKYHMKARVNAMGMTIDMDAYLDGELMAGTVDVMGTSARVVVRDGKAYSILDAQKIIMVGPIGDELEAARIETDGMVYSGSGTASFAGSTVSYEEYSNGDGAKVVYFMRGSELAGVRTVVPGVGTVDIEILVLDQNVPANVFEIPSGYGVMNVNGFM